MKRLLALSLLMSAVNLCAMDAPEQTQSKQKAFELYNQLPVELSSLIDNFRLNQSYLWQASA